jgi:hypothetical protein
MQGRLLVFSLHFIGWKLEDFLTLKVSIKTGCRKCNVRVGSERLLGCLIFFEKKLNKEHWVWTEIEGGK